MTTSVRVVEVSKSFNGIRAVDDVSLDVPRGTILGIIGPNGAGKTTLVRMMVGILHPTSGTCFIGDVESQSLGPRERCKIGYMTQQKALYPDLTARENLDFFAEANGLRDEREKSDAIIRVANLARIGEYLDRTVEVLSGGTVQRLSLACTLVHDPEVLFLDEPTVGVDPSLRIEFWEHFQEIARSGRTIIMTTHYLQEASRCGTVAMMFQGGIIAHGPPNEIVSSVPLGRTITGLVQPEDISRLEAFLQGVAPLRLNENRFAITFENDSLLFKVASAISTSGVRVSDVTFSRPNLEDAFDYFVRRNAE